VTRIVAHRGAWDDTRRQNTLEAFERAIAIGADMIELDVRRTGGEVVVAHDPLPREQGGIPLLADVLALARDRIEVNVELKEPGFVAEAVRLLKGFSPRCLLSSFLDDVLADAKAIEPELATALLVGPRAPDAPLERMRRCGADELGLAASLAAPRGACYFVWTVNDLAAIDRYLGDAAVTAIVTDRPALALERRGLLSGRTAPAAQR
jgi:glycerophosphoryl diester phosphodiesterase